MGKKKLNNAKEIIEFLSAKYIELLTKLVTKLIAENASTDEVKKTIRSFEIFEGIMAGKIPDENAPFLERNEKLVKEIAAYAKDIELIDSMK